eukprot:CAMPEP_0203859272 /NCGR_PEP_ID=MMETSP0359-20131031/11745_1 /ASSEMBLY_ACC=CAM_ASM_000338 /TAXON_ID=268821 /ORGANISM="Scrippsiella Hangoei, Strain SHTV-5" /LENGTH=65 /DNA_ID=CAMNT_0050776147 /DNA_START=51 /DNA_END=245 /DNA_ORIENTATION=-
MWGGGAAEPPKPCVGVASNIGLQKGIGSGSRTSRGHAAREYCEQNRHRPHMGNNCQGECSEHGQT